MKLGTIVSPDGGKPQSLAVDLPLLLETRMLVQANSGGGKSYLLRRVLEQTAPSVQQLVIDPEGEFATLREKFDYVIAAPHDADAVATPKTAALLARRLLEAGVSAVLDIYDLKPGERQAFVQHFLTALLNAPRKLWHPVLLVIDEAHVFCPQTGSAPASAAVIDVCTRGRKRGIGTVLATQRLSKLHKDAAAEMLNKLVGRTGLDVDVRRAADELGMTSREAMGQLRNLAPGSFFAFGPALFHSPQTTAKPIGGVELLQVGPVETTHPQSGQRLMEPPPAPSARVRAQLAKLADLQQEAVREAADNDALRAKVAQLERLVRHAQGGHSSGISEADVQKRIAAAVEDARKAFRASPIPQFAEEAVGALREASVMAQKIDVIARKALGMPHRAVHEVGSHFLDKQPIHAAIRTRPAAAPVEGLKSGAVRILQQLVARMPAGYTRAQVGALTGFAPKGGTFNTYLGALRRGEFIDERDGLVYATEAGAQRIGGDVPAAPTTHEEAMALWNKALKSGAFRMLEAIAGAGTSGLDRETLAHQVGMERSGGTFNTYLGILRRNGLVIERDGVAVANNILFPEGAR